MIRHLLTASIAAFAYAAGAQTPAPDAVREDIAARENAAAEQPFKDRHCVRETGSRIIVRDRDGRRGCQSGPGRSYDREELLRTGETDIGEALERLDPSITSRRR